MNSSTRRSRSDNDLPDGSLSTDALGGDSILITRQDADGTSDPDAWINGIAVSLEAYQ